MPDKPATTAECVEYLEGCLIRGWAKKIAIEQEIERRVRGWDELKAEVEELRKERDIAVAALPDEDLQGAEIKDLNAGMERLRDSEERLRRRCLVSEASWDTCDKDRTRLEAEVERLRNGMEYYKNLWEGWGGELEIGCDHRWTTIEDTAGRRRQCNTCGRREEL